MSADNINVKHKHTCKQEGAGSRGKYQPRGNHKTKYCRKRTHYGVHGSSFITIRSCLKRKNMDKMSFNSQQKEIFNHIDFDPGTSRRFIECHLYDMLQCAWVWGRTSFRQILSFPFFTRTVALFLWTNSSVGSWECFMCRALLLRTIKCPKQTYTYGTHGTLDRTGTAWEIHSQREKSLQSMWEVNFHRISNYEIKTVSVFWIGDSHRSWVRVINR